MSQQWLIMIVVLFVILAEGDIQLIDKREINFEIWCQ